MRVLVTGADGFAGRHLMARLADGFEPVASRADLTDRDALDAEIAAVRPDGCVHLAAIAAVPEAARDPDAAWRVNLHGTLDLGRAIMRHAPGCRLVFASSADVYGASFLSGLPLDETAVLAPANAYAATKAAADLALGAMARDGLRVVRVRAFNHTGPGQADAFVVPAFARQAARIAQGLQEPGMRVGDLSARRDFLDVRDVCRAYAACLLADWEPGAIVNVASGIQRRVGDVLDALLAMAGVQARLETDPARLRASDIPIAVGDSGLAARLLDWRPAIAWDTTLRDVLDDWTARARAEP